ncbi:MAG: LacI family transcriptional regulator [Anaerolineae bacterium]|nr:LacI family transcriptional regulator [Anaerolineae bacterium]
MNATTIHPTIADVARQAGVSTATVSRVINKSGNVTADTIVRVQAAIASLDYAPHSGARILASRRARTIGLITPTISDLFFTDLLRGIEQTVYENDYTLLVHATHGRPYDDIIPTLPLSHHNTDGLIIFTNSVDDAHLQKLHKRHFPLVLLHRSPPAGTDIPCVTFENKDGARQMTAHLIACGYRRIAFVAGPAGNEDAYGREQGYREALAAHGLVVDPALIVPGDFNAVVAGTAVTHLLHSQPTIDAIFAADDESARGALAAIRQSGRRMPQDIALAGFDDSLLSQYLNPPLTTVRAPIEAAGRAATAQLIQLIHTGHADPLTLLPTELVIRESCGWVLVNSEQ